MQKQELDEIAADIMLDLPQGVTIDGKPFRIYRQTLGTLTLTARWLQDLGIDENIMRINPTAEAYRLATTKVTEVSTLIAIRMTRDKEEIIGNTFADRLAFIEKISAQDRATLLLVVLTPDPTDELLKHLGIEREMRAMRCAERAKKRDKNNLTFGGVSQFGMHYEWCKELHLKPDEIVWGISWAKLQLMLADSRKDIYLTDKERKNAHIPPHGKRKSVSAEKLTKEQVRQIRGH